MATKLALKLRAHSVLVAYQLATTRCALEETSLNSHHRGQARGTAMIPIGLLLLLLLVKGTPCIGCTMPRP
eukprot:61600-Pelagomonas_calceolata.AAC.1